MLKVNGFFCYNVFMTLIVKKLGFDVSFEKLEIMHIVNLVWFNPITCAHYYDHRIKCFQKLCIKDDTIFGPLLDCFFVTKIWKLWKWT
jgi:hypothetical protein